MADDWFAQNAPPVPSAPPPGDWFAQNAPGGPSGISPEGLPIYTATSRQPSSWDRVVTSFGEFVNPLGEPTPGEGFETRLKKVAVGLSQVPLHMSESASAFGNAVIDGDIPGAAHHLVGLIPFMGPGAQQVEEDIRQGNWQEAIGHTLATVLMMRPHGPQELAEGAYRAGVENAPRISAGVVEGVKTGAKASVAPAAIKIKGLPIELPGVPAFVAGAATGAEGGHLIPGVGGVKGAIVGAAVPFGKGFVEGYRRGTADYLAGQRVGDTRIPIWEQGGEGGGPPPLGPFEGPIPQPVLPSGRIPGTLSSIAAGRTSPGVPPPQPIRPAAAAPEVAAPSPVAAAASAPPPLGPDPVRQTLSDMAAGSPTVVEEGTPLSEMAKPKRPASAQPQVDTAVVPTIETPETQAPALPGNETYAQINRAAKAEKYARYLAENGRNPEAEGWGEAEWKALAKELGDKTPPSNIALVREKLAELHQTGSIAASPNAQHAQSLFDAGVTYDDTLRYGVDQWKRSAEAAGVEVPKPADMAEIRGRLKLLDTARGKVDVGATLGAYLDAQGISEADAVKATPRTRQEYGVAAGTGKPTGVQWREAINELRRRGIARQAAAQAQAETTPQEASLSDVLEASVEAAKKQPPKK